VSTVGGFVEPPQCLVTILRRAPAIFVHEAAAVFGICLTLLRGLQLPPIASEWSKDTPRPSACVQWTCSGRRLARPSERTARPSSASGQTRLSGAMPCLSVKPPKAEIWKLACNVAEVRCVDGSLLARTFFTIAAGSVQPCVRPICAVHMTAGHNALRGSGAGQKPAFGHALAIVGRRRIGSVANAMKRRMFRV
jgi:hypothetical protein